MKPGSVLVDISIDQGGCFEDSRPTTHEDPTYRVHGSVFYCVANMPGAVPHTSTYALTNVTLPYAVALAEKGWREALRDDDSLALGLNTFAGEVTNEPVAERARAALHARSPRCSAEPGGPGSRGPCLPRPPGDERGLARTRWRRTAETSGGTSSSWTTVGSTTSPDGRTATSATSSRRSGGRPGPSGPRIEQRGPDAGRGPRVPPVRRPGGDHRSDPARSVKPPAPPKRLPRRCRSTRWSRSWPRPAPRVPRWRSATGHCSSAVRHRSQDLGGGRARRRRLDLGWRPYACSARGASSGCAGRPVRVRSGLRLPGTGRPALVSRCRRRSGIPQLAGWSAVTAVGVVRDRRAAERAGMTVDVSPHTLRHSSPPICWTVVRTSGSSRSCSDTRP